MRSNKNRINRVTAVALALFVAIAMMVGLQLRPVKAAVAFIPVTPDNLNGWVQAHSHCSGGMSTGSQEFVEGPATPPLNEGSLRFTIGADGDSFETIRTPDFNGTRIDDLTLLTYSTYVTNFNDEQAPYLLLSVDEDGDNVSNALWFFEPVYQDATFFPSNPQANVVEGAWQTWDALNGGWYSSSGLAGSGPGTNVKSIAQLLAAAPNARLAPTGTGSIRIATGCGGAAWANFDGNVDALMVGTDSESEMLPDNVTTYDFEPTPLVDGPCVPPPAGMVSWWPGDGTAEDIQDGNDGVLLNGATATATGEVGQAFSFDGVDDYVNVPNNPNLEPATITVDFWFNSAAPGANAYLLAKGAQTNQFASYSFNNSGTGGGLAFDVLVNNMFVRSPFSSPAVFDGQWHHATGTFDGSTVRLFIDGVEVGTGTPAV
ncbi:MAG TPA: LamG domain-containing protein, partial [Blastocatellia bacterium]|nr:LamG domain-containing protein [Blastocatellia bacterium]